MQAPFLRWISRPSLRPLLIVAGVAVLYGLYVLLAAFRADRTPPLAPGFAGAGSCADCHRSITERQNETHHAQALHTAAEFEARTTLPEPQWAPDPSAPAAYRIARREGQLGIEAQVRGKSGWQPLTWAFGSGTQAMTMVGRREDGSFVESPLTFFRRAGWDFTPGFLTQAPAARLDHPTGRVLSANDVADCFHCHAAGVRRSPQGVVLEGVQFGVRCESCHGPGAQHVREARAGRPRGNILMPGQI